MEIIIVQGMSCLGKTTLCRKLVKKLDSYRYFSLDTYKEIIWDSFGFQTKEQRDYQSKKARDLFYYDIKSEIGDGIYDYILVDYVFTEEYFNELIKNLNKYNNVKIKTIYLKPDSLEDHKKIWKERSRDFSIRHPGHGATIYNNKIREGYNYINKYDDKVFKELPTSDECLNIKVSFNPYSIDKSISEILEFIHT